MPSPTCIVILAGGRATRLGGGDKPLLTLGGQALLAHQLARLHNPDCPIILNANGAAGRFEGFGLPVLADASGDHPGPLAGVLAGLHWAARHGFASLLSVPGDCPFLPRDLLSRLAAARDEGADMERRVPAACAASGGQIHFVTTLWPVGSLALVSAALDAGERRVESVLDTIGYVRVQWPIVPHDPFFNINTPEDMQVAERILQLLQG